MSNETWLISRKVDASKKIFCGTKNLLFDFELFIGGHRQLASGIGCHVMTQMPQRKIYD